MPINGMTINDASTAFVAPTGGESITLTPDGREVANGIHVSDASNQSFLTRINATFRNRPPALQSDGTWSKAKRTGLIVEPMLLADGSYVFNLFRFEMEIHPETPTTAIEALRLNGVQIVGDADMDSFIHTGNIS